MAKSMPELVAKLGRAETVLIDAAKQSRPHSSKAQTVTDENSMNELLNNQRRIAIQQGLISKLTCNL